MNKTITKLNPLENTITFRNCENTFYGLYDIEEIDEEDFDEDVIVSYILTRVYINFENSNIIILSYYAYDEEDFDRHKTDGYFTDSITGFITDKQYNYLMDKLNNTKNMLVNWSQCHGTSSDYSRYYDIENLK